MKQFHLLAAVAIAAMSLTTSCVTTCCDHIRADVSLPLSSHVLRLQGGFSAIENNTALDIEYTQSDSVTAELACPDEVLEFVMFSISNDKLYISLSDKLSDEDKNQINTDLRHSKLFLTSPCLNSVRVNGSSTFLVTNELHAEGLTASIFGSGDIVFKGVNVGNGTISAQVTGSGDIKFEQEAKAKTAELELHGSGDIEGKLFTVENVAAQVVGSGDIKIPELVAQSATFNLNGSGDLVALRINATTVNATLVGSGDMKLEGSCQTAYLSLNSSGDIIARNLVAQNVTASVIGSGDLSCNAQERLTAKVSGSGDIRYKGNPDITYQSKSDNIQPF